MPQIPKFKVLMKFCLEMCWTVFVSPSPGGVQKMSSFWFYRSDLRRKWWWDAMRGHPPPPVVRASHMCCGVRREPGRQAPLCPELRSPAISQSEASLGRRGPIRGEQRWPALACVASEPAAARVVILKRRTGNNSKGCFTNNNWSWTQQHMYKTDSVLIRIFIGKQRIVEYVVQTQTIFRHFETWSPNNTWYLHIHTIQNVHTFI